MHVEYVTNAVPPGLLRCPSCSARVRQIGQDLPGKASIAIALCGEPLGWVVAGLSGLVGYATQAVWPVLLIWAVLGLPVLAWAYLRHLRSSEFLCSSCGAHSSYAQARGQKARVRP